MKREGRAEKGGADETVSGAGAEDRGRAGGGVGGGGVNCCSSESEGGGALLSWRVGSEGLIAVAINGPTRGGGKVNCSAGNERGMGKEVTGGGGGGQSQCVYRFIRLYRIIRFIHIYTQDRLGIRAYVQHILTG